MPKETIRLYIDADRTGTRESGLAIERGILTALSEVDNQLEGKEVEIVIKDHRGNSARSKRHLEEFLQDSLALSVFSGLHSPPLLVHREFINKNQIPVLDPWAAAGPITRYPSKSNWIFRLSIDDTKAGYVIARYAIKNRGFKRPYLMLENTGWGKSNKKTMTKALKELEIDAPQVNWFNWGLTEVGARSRLRTIVRSGADVIFLVANAPEGKTIAKAMLDLPSEDRLPICSHWGITGGDFPEVINAKMRKGLDLAFIQTKFSFVSVEDDPFGQQVLERARSLFPEGIKTAQDIKAPTGFIHAYDLTRLLIAAVEQAGFSGNIITDRKNLKEALENLKSPVKGLIKTYVKPFEIFDEKHPDAHEALGIQDFVMGRYGDENEIMLIR